MISTGDNWTCNLLPSQQAHDPTDSFPTRGLSPAAPSPSATAEKQVGYSSNVAACCSPCADKKQPEQALSATDMSVAITSSEETLETAS